MRKLALLAVFALVSTLTNPARAQFCPGVSPWVFDDVLASDPFCGFITWMADNGITLGCQTIDANHRLYCPADNVTRKQMAAFMNRLGNVRVEAVDTGSGLLGGPITGIGTISLAPTQLLPTVACANNQIPRWNGSAWACATLAAGGSVTSVGSGTGLTGGPITTSGTLSIATGYQLPQACANGQVAKSNGSGSWTCASDANSGGTVTSVGTGTGLTGGPITGAGTVNLASTQLLPTVACTNGYVPAWNGSAWACSDPSTFGGNINLSDSTSASVGNIIKAGNRFMHTYPAGNFNTYLGNQAGNFTNSGLLNTGLGGLALSSITTGTLNTAVGLSALFSTTDGYQNVAAGAHALQNNTSGYENTASGVYALAHNTTGSDNTAHGVFALYSNTTGFPNTATGAYALYSNTTGTSNTATGALALRFNTIGVDNTAVGNSALTNNNVGYGNTAVGSSAMLQNTSGVENVAFGWQALRNNTVGVANTAVGVFTLPGVTTQAGNTGIGYHANATGNFGTAIGNEALAAGDNATAIGFQAVADAADHVRIGNSSVTQISGQVAWSNLSDRRDKKDVAESSLGLDFIQALRPVRFKMKNGNGRTDLGFIAQEVEALLGTEYNVLGIGGTAERKLSLRYTDFIAPMVKAMQQQQAMIEAQAKEIAELRHALQAVLARLPAGTTVATAR